MQIHFRFQLFFQCTNRKITTGMQQTKSIKNDRYSNPSRQFDSLGYVNSKPFRKSNKAFRFRLNKHIHNGVHRVAKMWDAHATFFDFLSPFPRHYSNCISISGRRYGSGVWPYFYTRGPDAFWKIENWPSHDSGRPCARSVKVPWSWIF